MKKMVMGVVLVLIIIGAVVFVVKRMNRSVPPVDVVLDKTMIKYADITDPDPANFKIVDISLRVQDKEGTIVPETHYLYHAKSGKTYAHIIICMSCKRVIPVWPYGPGVDPNSGAETYRCPVCGGRTSGGGGGSPREPD